MVNGRLADRPPGTMQHFYDLTRTPVQEGEIVEQPCTLPIDVAPPQRPMLLTALGLEIPVPSATSIVGFAGGCFAAPSRSLSVADRLVIARGARVDPSRRISAHERGSNACSCGRRCLRVCDGSGPGASLEGWKFIGLYCAVVQPCPARAPAAHHTAACRSPSGSSDRNCRTSRNA